MAPRANLRREPVKVRGDVSLPDPDEVEAMKAATAAIAGAKTAEDAAYACISAWITTRSKRAASARLTDNVVFNLGDAKLRGWVAASLSSIGSALVEGQLAHIATGEPLASMDGTELVDFITYAILATTEAAVAANENMAFPFSDAVPF